MESRVVPLERGDVVDESARGSDLRVTWFDRVTSLMAALTILGGIALTLLVAAWFGRPTKQPVPVNVFLYELDTLGAPIRYPVSSEPAGYPEDQGQGLAAAEVEDDRRGYSRVSPVEGESSELRPWMATTAPLWNERMGDWGASGSVEEPVRELGSICCGPGPDWYSDYVPRWVLRLDTSDFDTYIEQLDSFGIEIGVIGNWESHVDYASAFSRDYPHRSKRDISAERRVFLGWRSGRRADFDSRLLAAAGIPHLGRIVAHFYPRKLEKYLLELEAAAAEGTQGGDRLEQTVFRARRLTKGEWAFVVEEVRFLSPATGERRQVGFADLISRGSHNTF